MSEGKKEKQSVCSKRRKCIFPGWGDRTPATYQYLLIDFAIIIFNNETVHVENAVSPFAVDSNLKIAISTIFRSFLQPIFLGIF